MSVCIKICGITNIADAEAAIAGGAQFLGLIFVPSSPRCIDVQSALDIADQLRDKKVALVGVFKDTTVAEMNAIADQVGLDYLQCHGAESPEMLRQLNRPAIKTIEVDIETNATKQHEDTVAAETARKVEQYRESAKFILFDRPKSLKDTGWLDAVLDFLPQSRSTLPAFFFAGGLSESNVAEVIEKLTPFAVDATSSIESEPGRKDLEKLRRFCDRVRTVGKQLSSGGSQ